MKKNYDPGIEMKLRIPKGWLSIQEFADNEGISYPRALKLVKDGRVSPVKRKKLRDKREHYLIKKDYTRERRKLGRPSNKTILPKIVDQIKVEFLMSVPEDVMSIVDAAKYIGVKPGWLNQLISYGRLKPRRIKISDKPAMNYLSMLDIEDIKEKCGQSENS